jgi:transcriptional regulator with PAS, ATPase and Fis domain
MKKVLAIVNYNPKTLNLYYEQLKSLFLDNLEIKRFCIESEQIKNEIEADMVLIPSYDAFEKIKKYIKENSEIIFCNRTISIDGLDKIKSIPNTSDVFLLDETLEMSQNMITVLYQIGVRNINLLPATPQCREILKDKTLIILGQSSFIPIEAKKIINVGSSLIDISTIVDIGIRLNLDHILNKQNITKNYKEFSPSNFGLAEILFKANSFESQLDILLQVYDDGVIAINSQGIVSSYNEAAKKIIGFRSEEVLERDGIKLFSQIPFKTVLKNKISIKEKLIKINDFDVIVSVNPIIHSDKLHGAVAVIKKFSETEFKQHKLRAQLIGKGHKAKYRFEDILGNSDIFIKCKDIALRMAKSNSTVLLTGRTGTGKELFAHAIHNSSNRKDYQFVVVNCGALPESLLESELFGYEEGAFTGARKGGKIGLFELAHRGTLFLDEIGEMPLNLQMRLLRVLQEREVMRIGGDRLINIDIRLIAASNRNLDEMVAKGEFREDLFYRLNVLHLKIPALNYRREDIMLLIDQFKKEFNGSFKLSENAKTAFLQHNYKGNVRELKNYVEYIVNLGIRVVDISDLPFERNNAYIDFNTDKVEVAINFINSLRGNKEKYIFVLEELEKGFKTNTRMGRRSIFLKAEENDVFLSEQEIRGILLNLEKHQLVEIYKGRSGSVITRLGIGILKKFKIR